MLKNPPYMLTRLMESEYCSTSRNNLISASVDVALSSNPVIQKKHEGARSPGRWGRSSDKTCTPSASMPPPYRGPTQRTGRISSGDGIAAHASQTLVITAHHGSAVPV